MGQLGMCLGFDERISADDDDALFDDGLRTTRSDTSVVAPTNIAVEQNQTKCGSNLMQSKYGSVVGIAVFQEKSVHAKEIN